MFRPNEISFYELCYVFLSSVILCSILGVYRVYSKEEQKFVMEGEARTYLSSEHNPQSLVNRHNGGSVMQKFDINLFLIPQEQQDLLDEIEEWRDDYVPLQSLSSGDSISESLPPFRMSSPVGSLLLSPPLGVSQDAVAATLSSCPTGEVQVIMPSPPSQSSLHKGKCQQTAFDATLQKGYPSIHRMNSKTKNMTSLWTAGNAIPLSCKVSTAPLKRNIIMQETQHNLPKISTNYKKPISKTRMELTSETKTHKMLSAEREENPSKKLPSTSHVKFRGCRVSSTVSADKTHSAHGIKVRARPFVATLQQMKVKKILNPSKSLPSSAQVENRGARMSSALPIKKAHSVHGTKAKHLVVAQAKRISKPPDKPGNLIRALSSEIKSRAQGQAVRETVKATHKSGLTFRPIAKSKFVSQSSTFNLKTRAASSDIVQTVSCTVSKTSINEPQKSMTSIVGPNQKRSHSEITSRYPAAIDSKNVALSETSPDLDSLIQCTPSILPVSTLHGTASSDDPTGTDSPSKAKLQTFSPMVHLEANEGYPSPVTSIHGQGKGVLEVPGSSLKCQSHREVTLPPVDITEGIVHKVSVAGGKVLWISETSDVLMRPGEPGDELSDSPRCGPAVSKSGSRGSCPGVAMSDGQGNGPGEATSDRLDSHPRVLVDDSQSNDPGIAMSESRGSGPGDTMVENSDGDSQNSGPGVGMGGRPGSDTGDTVSDSLGNGPSVATSDSQCSCPCNTTSNSPDSSHSPGISTSGRPSSDSGDPKNDSLGSNPGVATQGFELNPEVAALFNPVHPVIGVELPKAESSCKSCARRRTVDTATQIDNEFVDRKPLSLHQSDMPSSDNVPSDYSEQAAQSITDRFQQTSVTEYLDHQNSQEIPCKNGSSSPDSSPSLTQLLVPLSVNGSPASEKSEETVSQLEAKSFEDISVANRGLKLTVNGNQSSRKSVSTSLDDSLVLKDQPIVTVSQLLAESSEDISGATGKQSDKRISLQLHDTLSGDGNQSGKKSISTSVNNSPLIRGQCAGTLSQLLALSSEDVSMAIGNQSSEEVVSPTGSSDSECRSQSPSLLLHVSPRSSYANAAALGRATPQSTSMIEPKRSLQSDALGEATGTFLPCGEASNKNLRTHGQQTVSPRPDEQPMRSPYPEEQSMGRLHQERQVMEGSGQIVREGNIRESAVCSNYSQLGPVSQCAVTASPQHVMAKGATFDQVSSCTPPQKVERDNAIQDSGEIDSLDQDILTGVSTCAQSMQTPVAEPSQSPVKDAKAQDQGSEEGAVGGGYMQRYFGKYIHKILQSTGIVRRSTIQTEAGPQVLDKTKTEIQQMSRSASSLDQLTPDKTSLTHDICIETSTTTSTPPLQAALSVPQDIIHSTQKIDINVGYTPPSFPVSPISAQASRPRRRASSESTPTDAQRVDCDFEEECFHNLSEVESTDAHCGKHEASKMPVLSLCSAGRESDMGDRHPSRHPDSFNLNMVNLEMKESERLFALCSSTLGEAVSASVPARNSMAHYITAVDSSTRVGTNLDHHGGPQSSNACDTVLSSEAAAAKPHTESKRISLASPVNDQSIVYNAPGSLHDPNISSDELDLKPISRNLESNLSLNQEGHRQSIVHQATNAGNLITEDGALSSQDENAVLDTPSITRGQNQFEAGEITSVSSNWHDSQHTDDTSLQLVSVRSPLSPKKKVGGIQAREAESTNASDPTILEAQIGFNHHASTVEGNHTRIGLSSTVTYSRTNMSPTACQEHQDVSEIPEEDSIIVKEVSFSRDPEFLQSPNGGDSSTDSSTQKESFLLEAAIGQQQEASKFPFKSKTSLPEATGVSSSQIQCVVESSKQQGTVESNFRSKTTTTSQGCFLLETSISEQQDSTNSPGEGNTSFLGNSANSPNHQHMVTGLAAQNRVRTTYPECFLLDASMSPQQETTDLPCKGNNSFIDSISVLPSQQEEIRECIVKIDERFHDNSNASQSLQQGITESPIKNNARFSGNICNLSSQPHGMRKSSVESKTKMTSQEHFLAEQSTDQQHGNIESPVKSYKSFQEHTRHSPSQQLRVPASVVKSKTILSDHTDDSSSHQQDAGEHSVKFNSNFPDHSESPEQHVTVTSVRMAESDFLCTMEANASDSFPVDSQPLSSTPRPGKMGGVLPPPTEDPMLLLRPVVCLKRLPAKYLSSHHATPHSSNAASATDPANSDSSGAEAINPRLPKACARQRGVDEGSITCAGDSETENNSHELHTTKRARGNSRRRPISSDEDIFMVPKRSLRKRKAKAGTVSANIAESEQDTDTSCTGTEPEQNNTDESDTEEFVPPSRKVNTRSTRKKMDGGKSKNHSKVKAKETESKSMVFRNGKIVLDQVSSPFRNAEALFPSVSKMSMSKLAVGEGQPRKSNRKRKLFVAHTDSLLLTPASSGMQELPKGGHISNRASPKKRITKPSSQKGSTLPQNSRSKGVDKPLGSSALSERTNSSEHLRSSVNTPSCSLPSHQPRTMGRPSPKPSVKRPLTQQDVEALRIEIENSPAHLNKQITLATGLREEAEHILLTIAKTRKT